MLTFIHVLLLILRESKATLIETLIFPVGQSLPLSFVCLCGLPVAGVDYMRYCLICRLIGFYSFFTTPPPGPRQRGTELRHPTNTDLL